jgi:hypothetical protein
MKAYDGTVCLYEDILMLQNAKGSKIGARPRDKHDSFSVGAKIYFSQHVVRMGLPKVSFNKSTRGFEPTSSADIVPVVNVAPSIVLGKATQMGDAANSSSQSDIPRSEVTRMDNDCSSSVYASLKLGFDFSHGRNFSKDVRSKFHSTVHPSNSSGHFTMVVSFGRANFRMDEDLVALALEACLCGLCGELLVSTLKDRVFSFAVASKEVAFHILKLKQYRCQQFKCYFHLWSRGGPNWMREFSLWQQECQTEWILVSPSKRAMQLGLSAMKTRNPKSIVRKTVGPRKILAFADELSYSACKGYHKSEPSRSVSQEVTSGQAPYSNGTPQTAYH